MGRRPTQTKDYYRIRGYEIVTKIVGRTTRAGRIYLPKAWVGKTVKVIRIDPLEEEEC